MKNNRIILAVLILSTIAIIFSGCGGGNPVTPPIDNDDNSDIPEPTEAISQQIDLSVGGEVEITDPESIISGVKLIIPPIPSEKRGGKSIATFTISYIDNPYSLELPDNRGFLLPPVVINSDILFNAECILEIPYTEDDLNNMGYFNNSGKGITIEGIKTYVYDAKNKLWKNVSMVNNWVSEKKAVIVTEINMVIDETLIVTATLPLIAGISHGKGFPQPGDLLYRLSNFLMIKNQWVPGHVGIYVGEKYGDHDNDPSTPDKDYNVIEALGVFSFIHFKMEGKVEANYYNPISEFAGDFTYMGAAQPKTGALTSEQRKDVLEFLDKNKVVGKPYAGDETKLFLYGLARGKYVKGMFGDYNCVGLAEAAYEYAEINGGIGLVTDEHEGNNASDISARAVLSSEEQYEKTEPAEGYTVSGRVTDSQSNEIPGVTINFELVSFNDYHSSFKETTDSDGDWSSGKLGREWNVTPQKDGYTFEPSTIKVKEDANDINFTGTTIYNYPIVDSFSVTPTSITLGDSFKISYTVSDDIGLQQTELWRVNDVGGEPGDWDTSYNPIFTKVLSGQKNYSGSFTDTPDTAGTYWYGMHVVDTSGNWSVEPKPPGPIVVTVTSVTPETYTITASAGPNGSISPSGNVTVNQGSDKLFTITPETGYSIADVLVDGSSAGTVSSYTFINVTEDHTISTTFKSSVVPGLIHNITKGTYYSTIQEALDDADNDNTIEVSNGTYDESITLPFIKKIILRSVNGASSTIIRGSDDSATVTTDAVREGTVLEGFTITHKSGEKGRGIYTNGNLTIKNCTISNNFSNDDGVGIYNYEGTITITGSTISGNSNDILFSVWASGGGIYNNWGTITITGSTISDNASDWNGGGINNRYGPITITGSTISSNSAFRGGGVFNQSASITITGSTISDNSSKWGGGGGIYNCYPPRSITIAGCTISGNSSYDSNAGIYFSYCTSGTLPIGGSIEAEKNTICGNYKSGEVLSLVQQIMDDSGSLYERYKDTNYISVYCD
jgi:hypothetical protein